MKDFTQKDYIKEVLCDAFDGDQFSSEVMRSVMKQIVEKSVQEGAVTDLTEKQVIEICNKIQDISDIVNSPVIVTKN